MSVKRYSVGVDGVDPNGNLVKYTDYAALEARCAALAAEVYDLKHPGTYLPSKRETPALDAFLAEVRASAITDALKSLDVVFDTDCVMESNGISYEDAEQRTAGAYAVSKALEEFAAQLRKGVQS